MKDRALSVDELPDPVPSFVRALDHEPRSSAADPLVATDGDMAYRVVQDSAGHRLEHLSLHPPRPGTIVIDGVSMDDVCRLLIAALGDRMPWMPGSPRYGLPRTMSSSTRIDRLRDVPLDRLASAYLTHPDGVLDRLAEPAAIHLIDDSVLALARTRGWDLLPTDGPDGVRLTDGDVDLRLRRTDDEFIVERRPEKSNVFHEVLSTHDLRTARTVLERELRSAS